MEKRTARGKSKICVSEYKKASVDDGHRDSVKEEYGKKKER